MRSVVGGLTLNRERAAAAASGLLLATDVADYLVGKGVPFRRAHEVVGALVRKLVAEGRDFESLSLDGVARGQRPVRAPMSSRRVTPAASVAGQADAAIDGAGRRSAAAGRRRAWLADVGWTLLPLGNQLC